MTELRDSGPERRDRMPVEEYVAALEVGFFPPADVSVVDGDRQLSPDELRELQIAAHDARSGALLSAAVDGTARAILARQPD